MKWTKEPPKKEGWHWCKWLSGQKEIVFINGAVDGKEFWRFYQSINYTKSCLWAGPIKEPDGTKEDSKPIGRPRVNVSRDTVLFIQKKGLSLNQIAMNLGIGKATVYRILKEGS